MGKTNLDKTCIFKINTKTQFFSCNYWFQNSIFESFGYYLAGSLLTTLRYHELFDTVSSIIHHPKRHLTKHSRTDGDFPSTYKPAFQSDRAASTRLLTLCHEDIRRETRLRRREYI